MKPYKIIRDPLHGDIGLSQLEVELIDTKWVQRLRHIKQNGFCFLVYPAMNSTRFEHSLGVMHLAGTLGDNLELSKEEKIILRVAGLLHDVGHLPFSHSTEAVLKRRGVDHEELSKKIVIESEISDILKRNGINPFEITQMISGESRLGQVISSQIDVDKMDYLIRDAYYAGVAYGITDIERVLLSINLDDEISVKKGGLEAVESLLVNRNLMYQTVYRHHTKRIAESMFIHALEFLISDGFEFNELSRMDDISLVAYLRSVGGFPKEIMDRLDSRRLHKNIFQEKIVELDDEFSKELKNSQFDVEKNLGESLQLDYGDILIDYPEVKLSEFRILVEVDGELTPIDEVSPIAKSLEENEKSKLYFNIYASRDKLELLKDFNPHSFVKYKQMKIDSFI